LSKRGNEMEIWRGIKREIFQRGKNKMGFVKEGGNEMKLCQIGK